MGIPFLVIWSGVDLKLSSLDDSWDRGGGGRGRVGAQGGVYEAWLECGRPSKGFLVAGERERYPLEARSEARCRGGVGSPRTMLPFKL